jgi:hypothetical protein
LAQGNNNSNRNGTLPSPELNPLINPVLGAHMGRWAEVYFTSPPEKREEAVLELLRELQGGTSDMPPVTSVPDPGRLRRTDPTGEPNLIGEPEPEWAVCESCGGRNVIGNRFCGMCGGSLGQASSMSLEEEQPAELPRGMWGGPFVEDPSANQQQNEWYNGGLQEHHHQEGEEIESDRFGRPEQDFLLSKRGPPRESAPITPQFEMRPQSTWPSRPDVPSLISYEEAPNRRRLYIGALVGIVVIGLVYVAWKGSSGGSETAHTLPQATPQSAETQPATPDQAPAPGSQAENAPAPAVKAPSVPARKPAATTGRAYNKPSANTNHAESNAPAPTSEQAAGPIVASLQGNGSEELTVAESYLNGTGGRARDTGEAAKWLWRSLSKKNGAAALLLSDLYVHGDGVPKSCDQARLLLDAAARKGVSGAAQRLQNLPSLGCQ